MPGNCTGLRAAAHAQLAIDTADLRLHCIEGDDQFLSDLRIGAPGDEQAENAALLRAQRFKRGLRKGGTALSYVYRGLRSTRLLRERRSPLFLLEGREQG